MSEKKKRNAQFERLIRFESQFISRMSESENASPNVSPVKSFMSLLAFDKSQCNVDTNTQQCDWANVLLTEKSVCSVDIPVNLFSNTEGNGPLKMNNGESFKWSGCPAIGKIENRKLELEEPDGLAAGSHSPE
jgi:hypothetical protein